MPLLKEEGNTKSITADTIRTLKKRRKELASKVLEHGNTCKRHHAMTMKFYEEMKGIDEAIAKLKR